MLREGSHLKRASTLKSKIFLVCVQKYEKSEYQKMGH